MEDPLKEIIRKYGTYISVYIAKETITNAHEGTVDLTYYTPNPIKGILEDMSDASAVYKMPGIASTDSKIFVCHSSYKEIIEASHKIEINGKIFYGYKDGNGSKIRIKTEGSYLRIYLTRKLFV